jgi:hypothetical protein
MTKPKIRTRRLKWKNLGFIPEGWDESQMIKYGDEGFLFLCNELRDDYRKLTNYTVKDRKRRPGWRGGNCSHDWSGLDEANYKPGAKTGPPNQAPKVLRRTLCDEERQQLGRTAHQNWVAVLEQHRKCGREVSDADLRTWLELCDEEREMFRRSGEALALSDYVIWDWLAGWRKMVGEKTFRKKMFELSVSAAMQTWNSDWTDAQRYMATDIIVKLSEMLNVPPPAETASGAS